MEILSEKRYKKKKKLIRDHHLHCLLIRMLLHFPGNLFTIQNVPYILFNCLVCVWLSEDKKHFSFSILKP